MYSRNKQLDREIRSSRTIDGDDYEDLVGFLEWNMSKTILLLCYFIIVD